MNDLLAILATWRLSSLLYAEPGPANIFGRLRAYVGIEYDERSKAYGHNEIARAFMCLWCLSMWVGLVLALLKRRDWRAVVDALAYSGGAIVIEKFFIKR